MNVAALINVGVRHALMSLAVEIRAANHGVAELWLTFDMCRFDWRMRVCWMEATYGCHSADLQFPSNQVQ